MPVKLLVAGIGQDRVPTRGAPTFLSILVTSSVLGVHYLSITAALPPVPCSVIRKENWPCPIDRSGVGTDNKENYRKQAG